ncbi:MAG: hypothetical protein H6Q42_1698 [Deltaproteobacteria bacterium]|nr:hypothetical protein [Deltaproteobacteria bacterium]
MQPFEDLVKETAREEGMPYERFIYVPTPVSSQPRSVVKKYLEGNDPVTGKPVMQEIIDALTKPLTSEEAHSGPIPSVKEDPRIIGPDTEENLRQLFMNKGWTDGLPIILPTEERVAAMLKGTSHKPDEVVGKMSAGPHPARQYTVEKVAVNAVMAGCKPEYFPVVLALASSAFASTSTSTTSFARMAVVNGPIAKEIGMNSGIGALSPWGLNQANATSGRAWTLITLNLSGMKPGVSYWGSQGNNLNYNNIFFAENEAASPWEPYHVQKGAKKEESVISVFSGRSFTSTQAMTSNWKWEMIQTSKAFYPSPGSGLTLLVDPLIVREWMNDPDFNTKEKVSEWLYENTTLDAKHYKAVSFSYSFAKPQAEEGVEPYASWYKLPDDALIKFLGSPDNVNIIVVGGGTQAFGYALDFSYVGKASIDKWR